MATDEWQAMFRDTLSPQNLVRRAAEERIKVALEADIKGSLLGMFNMAASDDVSLDVRLGAAIRVKNFFKFEFDDKVPAQQEVLVAFKASVLNVIYRVPKQIVTQLLECIRCSIEVWPRDWPELLPAAHATLCSTTDPHCLHVALLVAYVVMRRFKVQGMCPAEERDEAASLFLVQIPNILAAQNSPDVMHMSVKIFKSCIMGRVPSCFKSDTNFFAGWLQHLLTFARTPPTQPALEDQYLTTLKHVADVSTYLQRHAKATKTGGQLGKTLSAVYMNNFSTAYLEAWVSTLQNATIGDSQRRKVNINAMNFIHAAVKTEAMYKLIHPSLGTLLTNTLFKFIPFNEEDQALWQEDPREYLRLAMDPGQEDTAERHVAMRTIISCVEAKEAWRDRTILHHFLGFLSNLLSQPDGNNVDGAFHCIGMMWKVIKKDEQVLGQMEHVLTQYVVPRLQSNLGYIRAKAVWICGQYTRLKYSSPEAFHNILRAVLGVIQDPQLPVRVQVVATLVHFIPKKASRAVVQPVLNPLVDECMRLISEIDNEYVILTLQVLIEVYGPELMHVMAPICEAMMKHFQRILWDLKAVEDTDVQELTDEAAGKYDEAAMAASAVLDAIVATVESMQYHPEMMMQVQASVSRFLIELLTLENSFDFLEGAVALMKCLLFGVPTILDETWELLPVIYKSVTTDALDYFDKFAHCLDNFVSSDSASFCAKPERVHCIIDMCRLVLGDNALHPQEVVSAPQLFESMLQHCQSQGEAFAPFIPTILDVVLGAMNAPQRRADNDLMRILCNCIMDALWCNTAVTIRHLDSLGATQTVFQSYFTFIEAQTKPLSKKMKKAKAKPAKFTIYDRKVQVLGLTAFLRYLFTNPTAALSWVVTPAIQLCISCIEKSAPEYTRRVEAIKKKLADGDDYEEYNSEAEEEGNLTEYQAEGGDETAVEDAGAGDEDEIDWGDGYTSVIDTICEATDFGNFATAALQSPLLAQAGAGAVLTPTVLETVVRPAAVAITEYIQLDKQLEAQDKADAVSRAAAADSGRTRAQ